MFYTLRFERHTDGYEVYGCQRYSVSACDSEGNARNYREIQLFSSLEDTNPFCVQIGDDQPFMVVFVTNATGKTIDRIE